MIRKDHDDVLYLKQATKFNAVADEIETIHKKWTTCIGWYS